MTTKEFIYSAWNGKTRARACASVFYSDGAIYSYGYHYPLLFRIGNKTIRNTTGYSSTTDRHISWSRDVDAIDINAGYQFRLSGNDADNLRELIAGQTKYIEQLRAQMDAKQRKDTNIYKWLEWRYDRACNNLAELTAE